MKMGIGTSPVVERCMPFPVALLEAERGKEITKLDWGNKKIAVYFNGKGTLCIRKEDGKEYHLILSREDVLGEDWVLAPTAPAARGSSSPVPYRPLALAETEPRAGHEILKDLVLAKIGPEEVSDADVAGAKVRYNPDDAEILIANVLRVAEVDHRGNVFIDLFVPERMLTIKSAPHGEGPGCWSFPLERG